METVKVELNLNVMQIYQFACLLLGGYFNEDEEIEIRNHTLEQHLTLFMLLPDNLKAEIKEIERQLTEDKPALLRAYDEHCRHVRNSFMKGGGDGSVDNSNN